MIAAKEAGSAAPVRNIEGNSFMYIRHKDMFFVAVSRSNANAALVFAFLYAMIDIFKGAGREKRTRLCSVEITCVVKLAPTHILCAAPLTMWALSGYFEDDFDEDSIRDNFTLVYELLDEIIDFGYPQNAALDVLKLYINLGSLKVQTSAQEDRKMTSTITGARDWRREGIVHKKNEVFIDVLESVNLLLSATGTVLRNDVTGQVRAVQPARVRATPAISLRIFFF